MSYFKWRHFGGEVILRAVRRYCEYKVTYCALKDMLYERDVDLDH
jgi:transposase-like protein